MRVLNRVLGVIVLGGLAWAGRAAPIPAAPADPAWGAPLPWSRFARVETLPGLQAIAKLNDGDP
jgi:hypothetical protein